VDYLPFPGAAGDLAKGFDVEFSNGYARAGHWERGNLETSELGIGLSESAETRGWANSERITQGRHFHGFGI
jgi:hypothetical protein